MNPIEKRVSMVEASGGGQLPSLTLAFATVEDMQAASDFIRAAYTKLTDERRERAMQSLVSDVLRTPTVNGDA